MFKLLGFLLIFLSVLGGFYMEDGPLHALYQPSEFIIIGGAAIGFLAISQPFAVFKGIGQFIQRLFHGSQYSPEFYQQLLQLLFHLFNAASSKGLKGMEDDIDKPEGSILFRDYPLVISQPRLIHLISDTLRLMMIQKIPPHEMATMLEEEIEGIHQDLNRTPDALLNLADALPGFGILAAVMGIIVTMGSIDGSLVQIGIHVASALTGTFLGIFLSYGFASPLARAIENEICKEVMALDVIKSALVAFNSGKPPMLAVDAGRRSLYSELKPSFIDMENELNGQ
ncbi:flagellar motor stator protein MotA [Vibrio marisflavi]|uniref:Chemotaxis protein LafT n=1 Tax=Vibrio marisflavi CECT 7928 TaxID=634439 RepID=A0ABN8E6Q7_9VIBR|nr:flagellar motor stator protein MotA [Vibrio marisflavi]CAH0540031.1 Chemotaxis protein LafT [Vibrio marisflavi CECT 7928]